MFQLTRAFVDTARIEKRIRELLSRRQCPDGQGEIAVHVRLNDVVKDKLQNRLLQRGETIVVP